MYAHSSLSNLLKHEPQEAVDVAKYCQLKLIAALDQGRDFANALAVGRLSLFRSGTNAWGPAFPM